MALDKVKVISSCKWFYCPICLNVWYVESGPGYPKLWETSNDIIKPTQKCPECRRKNIQRLDIKEALCSWVDNEINCKAIFGRNGYYEDASRLYAPTAWRSYFEKELVNFDGNFKQIISYLINKSRDEKFRIEPDVYKTKTGHFKTFFPGFQEAINKEVPRTNTLKIVDFLMYEGALQKDNIAFSFCPDCGLKDKLDNKMEERACEGCGFTETITCDESCLNYNPELGECESYGFPKDCCFVLPDGDCLGPRLLEVTCRGCGSEYTDAIVEFEYSEKREIDRILNPEDCDCFGLRYKLVPEVLQKLSEGFTFQEMVFDRVTSQGWETVRGRVGGRSGVAQDVDILCEEDGNSILIECKRLGSTKAVSLDVILNLFARMIDLEVDKGLVVTTSLRFSEEAIMFSEYYRVKILNIKEFLARDLLHIIKDIN